MTDTDLRARLDAAITAARRIVMGNANVVAMAQPEGVLKEDIDNFAAALDRYAALVELRARWEVIDREPECSCGDCWPAYDARSAEIEADVRRLLPVDGSTEAHSARKHDQPSG